MLDKYKYLIHQGNFFMSQKEILKQIVFEKYLNYFNINNLNWVIQIDNLIYHFKHNNLVY